MFRSGRPLATRQFWRQLLATMLACGAVLAQSGTQRPAQGRDCEDRAAVLRAMVILKIAPYITPANAPDGPAGTKSKRYRVGIVGTDPVGVAALREMPG